MVREKSMQYSSFSFNEEAINASLKNKDKEIKKKDNAKRGVEASLLTMKIRNSTIAERLAIYRPF